MEQVLIYFRETGPYLVSLEAKQVYHHDTSRTGSQVAPVTVVPDMLIDFCSFAETELFSFFYSDNETISVKFDPGGAEPLVSFQIPGQ